MGRISWSFYLEWFEKQSTDVIFAGTFTLALVMGLLGWFLYRGFKFRKAFLKELARQPK